MESMYSCHGNLVDAWLLRVLCLHLQFVVTGNNSEQLLSLLISRSLLSNERRKSNRTSRERAQDKVNSCYGNSVKLISNSVCYSCCDGFQGTD